MGMKRNSAPKRQPDAPIPDSLGSALGAKVKELRLARGETLTEAAACLKIAKSYLSLLEAGKAPNVGSEVVLRIAIHYQCSADYLLGLPQHGAAKESPAGEQIRRLARAVIKATLNPAAKIALDKYVDQHSD